MSSVPVECLVLGLPGVGKTLFALTLAGVTGHSKLHVYWEEPGGRVASRSWSIEEAKAALVGRDSGPHGLQWMTLSVPMGLGRGRRDVLFIDPAGLPPEIASDPRSRDGAARTLSLLRRARFLVHLVDASARESPSDLDRAVVRFASAQLPGRFLVLASKMDLPQSSQGLRRMRRAWPKLKILPISSLRRKSLAAVGRELRRCLDERSSEPGTGETR